VGSFRNCDDTNESLSEERFRTLEVNAPIETPLDQLAAGSVKRGLKTALREADGPERRDRLDAVCAEFD